MAEYFEQRAMELEEEVYSKSLDFIKRLKKLFRESEKAVKLKINEFYADFAIENQISYRESQRILNSDEFRNWRMSIDDYIALAEDTGDESLIKELDILSKRSQINRLDSLLTQIKAEQDLLYSKQLSLFNQHMTSIYSTSYYTTVYNTQNYLKLYYSFAVVDSDVIKKILMYKNAGSTLSQKIWGNHRKKLFAEVQEKIAQGLATSKGNREIVKEIAERYQVAYSNASRLVRTESSFYLNQANLTGLKETFADEYIYVATLDKRTSDICRELDGKIFKITDAKVGVNYPPMHPYCRSTTAIYIPDVTKYEQRVMRNNDRKSVVKEYMTYSEWENKFIK